LGVIGLRDDEEESFYGNRSSFVSEYSLRDEGVQAFFKEHGRTGSKDSQSSFLSRKKATQASSKRPDTKVKLGNSNGFRVPLFLFTSFLRDYLPGLLQLVSP
jgi:hypothetical protein